MIRSGGVVEVDRVGDQPHLAAVLVQHGHLETSIICSVPGCPGRRGWSRAAAPAGGPRRSRGSRPCRRPAAAGRIARGVQHFEGLGQDLQRVATGRQARDRPATPAPGCPPIDWVRVAAERRPRRRSTATRPRPRPTPAGRCSGGPRRAGGRAHRGEVVGLQAGVDADHPALGAGGRKPGRSGTIVISGLMPCPPAAGRRRNRCRCRCGTPRRPGRPSPAGCRRRSRAHLADGLSVAAGLAFDPVATCRLRDQYVPLRVVRVRRSASSSIQASIRTRRVVASWTMAGTRPSGFRFNRAPPVGRAQSPRHCVSPRGAGMGRVGGMTMKSQGRGALRGPRRRPPSAPTLCGGLDGDTTRAAHVWLQVENDTLPPPAPAAALAGRRSSSAAWRK